MQPSITPKQSNFNFIQQKPFDRHYVPYNQPSEHQQIITLLKQIQTDLKEIKEMLTKKKEE